MTIKTNKWRPCFTRRTRSWMQSRPRDQIRRTGAVHQPGRTRLCFKPSFDSTKSIPDCVDILPVDAAARDTCEKNSDACTERRQCSRSHPGRGCRCPQTRRNPLAPVWERRNQATNWNSDWVPTYSYQWFHMAGRKPGRGIGSVLSSRDTTDDSLLQDPALIQARNQQPWTLTAGIGHELNNPLFGILG